MKSEGTENAGEPLAVLTCPADATKSRVLAIAALLEQRRLADKARIDRIQQATADKHVQMLEKMNAELQAEASVAHREYTEAEVWRGRHAQSFSWIRSRDPIELRWLVLPVPPPLRGGRQSFIGSARAAIYTPLSPGRVWSRFGHDSHPLYRKMPRAWRRPRKRFGAPSLPRCMQQWLQKEP